ncbi:MAG: flotillin family protein [Chlamydiales bacterium]|nr:flotillin family protein [Chlamydiales bacterium]
MVSGFFSSAVVAGAAFIFATFLFLAKIYRRCPSNQILVVFGRVGQKRSVQCYHGGGTFVWPLIQASAYLNLTPRSIHIPLKGALSQQNIRINVPSTFTVAVGITPEVMHNAAVRMLGLGVAEIESMATEIIIGQLRLTVASLKIEEINQDRERFLDAIKNNIEPELHKIGLTLINVNITDITDESEYIDSIGKKAAATAVNQAKIDVAEEEKKGEIGKAEADRERRIQVAMHHAKAVEGENLAKAEMAATNALLKEKEAEAEKRSQVAHQVAEVSIHNAKAEAETSRLKASQIVPQEIAKQKMEIEADAQAQKRIREARGEADAILALRQAESEGLKKVLEAKAKGFKELVDACGDDTSSMLLIEKLEEVVRLQTEAIRNIKIDKITVWDSGESKEGKRGTTTSNFLSNMVKSVPALHDVAEMAGVELPGYLGKVKGSKTKE